MPPAPSGSTISYGPIRVPREIISWWNRRRLWHGRSSGLLDDLHRFERILSGRQVGLAGRHVVLLEDVRHDIGHLLQREAARLVGRHAHMDALEQVLRG